MRVYGEDGQKRPLHAAIGGRGTPNTVAVRNTGPMEFPIAASTPNTHRSPTRLPTAGIAPAVTIQGGAERTWPFDWSVASVQIHLTSAGMPINARIELRQGPNCIRQGIELYSDDGRGRPISYVLETPGPGCVVEIINDGPMEYPLTASVAPHSIDRDEMLAYGNDAIIGGDGDASPGSWDSTVY